MTGHRPFRPRTGHGQKVGRVNSRPSTRFTLQRLQELSKTSRKVVAGRRPDMGFSRRKSRFPTTENRTSQRSLTLRSIRPERRLKVAAKAMERVPGWVFKAIAKFVSILHRKRTRPNLSQPGWFSAGLRLALLCPR